MISRESRGEPASGSGGRIVVCGLVAGSCVPLQSATIASGESAGEDDSIVRSGRWSSRVPPSSGLAGARYGAQRIGRGGRRRGRLIRPWGRGRAEVDGLRKILEIDWRFSADGVAWSGVAASEPAIRVGIGWRGSSTFARAAIAPVAGHNALDSWRPVAKGPWSSFVCSSGTDGAFTEIVCRIPGKEAPQVGQVFGPLSGPPVSDLHMGQTGMIDPSLLARARIQPRGISGTQRNGTACELVARYGRNGGKRAGSGWWVGSMPAWRPMQKCRPGRLR